MATEMDPPLWRGPEFSDRALVVPALSVFFDLVLYRFEPFECDTYRWWIWQVSRMHFVKRA